VKFNATADERREELDRITKTIIGCAQPGRVRLRTGEFKNRNERRVRLRTGEGVKVGALRLAEHTLRYHRARFCL
jgi:hypothetical protein